MLDAIMEFTSAAHMPSVFTENAGIPVKPGQVLPTRMEGNQLHRYSKVLESNIGDVHSTRVLPTCPHLKWAVHHALNRTAPSNLYKAQKLLSMSLDVPPLPVLRDDMLLERRRLLPDQNFGEVDDWIGVHDSAVFGAEDHMTWSLLWIFLLLCVVCFISYRYCKARYRLRRRKPRLQKLISAVAGPRNV
jgi:membrane-bound transcription factor site-1 protease